MDGMINQFSVQMTAFLVALTLATAAGAQRNADTPSTADTPSPVATEPATTSPEASSSADPKFQRPTPVQELADSYSQTQWLNVANENIFSLYQPDNSGQAQGAVLILHRGEQPPWWSQSLEQLRETLPDYGWATYLVLLPTETAPIPKRPAKKIAAPSAEEIAASEQESAPEAEETEQVFDSNSGEVVSTETMNQVEDNTPAPIEEPQLPLRERTEQRVMAAMHALHNKNQFNLALMSDSTTAPIACEVVGRMPAAGTNSPTAISAQFILNYNRDWSASQEELEKSLCHAKVALLDIYIDQASNNQMIRKERRRQAKRQQYPVFQQLNLNSLERDELSKRVRGFLNKHAAGMEISK